MCCLIMWISYRLSRPYVWLVEPLAFVAVLYGLYFVLWWAWNSYRLFINFLDIIKKLNVDVALFMNLFGIGFISLYIGYIIYVWVRLCLGLITWSGWWVLKLAWDMSIARHLCIRWILIRKNFIPTDLIFARSRIIRTYGVSLIILSWLWAYLTFS